MADINKVRIDKWLWAVRIFKTRTLAKDACDGGRVKIGGKSVKPSRMLHVGETVNIQKGQEKKVLKVLSLIEKRVGAPLAVQCYEDHSPVPMPKDKPLKSIFYEVPTVERKRGTGRPTKKDRRSLEKHYRKK